MKMIYLKHMMKKTNENDIFKTYDEENHNLKIEKKHKLVYIEILN